MRAVTIRATRGAVRRREYNIRGPAIAVDNWRRRDYNPQPARSNSSCPRGTARGPFET